MTALDENKWTRSDGDSWDIVTSVGYTALGVCAQRALETERQDALINDPYAKPFVLSAGEPHLVHLVTHRDIQPTSPFECVRVMGVRSKYFDDYFLDAASAGIRQMVILAAGLDARAHRLPWPSGVTVYELDQPKVLEFKDGVYAELGAAPTSDRRIVAVDLRDDWPAALTAAGFDPSQPTAWSAEGLLPYLPGVAEDLLFERIIGLSAPGSRVAVESPSGGLGMTRFAAIQQKYRSDNDVFGKIDISNLFYDEEKVPPAIRLGDRGWAVETFNPLQLAEKYHLILPEVPADMKELASDMHYMTASLPR